MIDVGYYFWLLFQGAPAGRVLIGGAGVFDAIVVAGVFAVFIGEIVGEVRERLQGGPARRGRPEELLEGLRKPLLAEDRETMLAGDREAAGRQGGTRDEEGEK